MSRRALQRRIREDARATYDAFADDYDEHLTAGCSYTSPGRVAQRVAALSPHGRWLDVGAGTGLLGEALASRNVRIELVGLDVSAAMLAQVTCPLYVSCHRGDVLTRIPGHERFSGAMASGLMEYVVDVPALLHRIGRRLVEGGALVFTFAPTRAAEVRAFDEESDLHAHEPDHLRRCLDEAGFVDISMSRAFRAYQNGDAWVRHRIVTARRGAVIEA
ncbi:MAG: methyltransferase domain-containing protein [Nannocystaceae bacterium]|nr:methyltransferase domain-containing protein [Nannocystaceae bacterium]